MVRVLLGRGVGVHFYGWLVDVCFSRIPMESSKFEEKNGVEERRCGDEEKTSSGLYVYTLHTQKCPKSAVWPPLSPSLPHVLQFPCTYGLLTTAHSHVPLCFALLTLCFSPFIYITFSKARNIQSQNQMVSIFKKFKGGWLFQPTFHFR